ncbi:MULTISPECIES: hypothetical protein [Pseudomonas]|uniref:Uncharacterized protein n=1 Tax=Pseudomonas fragariae (ex Marin et al. 2024) TaxID=3080056 RepID=A0ABU5BAK3_9PSED|nr:MULTISPECIES: hypothetical protein [Pseudomonas]MDV0428061.1 hypothetical protein [Pseudomonas sp. 17]MDX9574418.1 hypothetical protein [Pseudomonas sp. 21(2023)]MDX9588602.1 hypothetical protein [Pseudomonas sp. 19(2023)]MDX9625527.1 hypothetical protein [Pseudomonas sp. 20]MDY6479775.1 hypothetical protein [Pseudomonas sp. 18]
MSHTIAAPKNISGGMETAAEMAFTVVDSKYQGVSTTPIERLAK